jgi:hypothetical protein
LPVIPALRRLKQEREREREREREKKEEGGGGKGGGEGRKEGKQQAISFHFSVPVPAGMHHWACPMALEVVGQEVSNFLIVFSQMVFIIL